MHLRLSVLFVCLLTPSWAAAHPLIDQGMESYEEADFDKSLRYFDQAADGSELSTADLMLLFEWRAIVRYALDNEPGMRADLRRLASMKPTHRLGRVAPPKVRAAFDEVRAKMTDGIDIDVGARTAAGKLRIEARARHDVTNLTRGARIHYRLPDGDWQSFPSEEVVVDLEDGGEVAYYAELLGPGGAVLATKGSGDEPRKAYVSSAGANPHRMKVASYYLFGAAAAVGASAITLGVLASKDYDELKKRCPDETCTTDQTGLADQVDRRSLAADIGYAIAASSAVTGVVLFIIGNKRIKDEKSAGVGLEAKVDPWLGRKAAGAALRLSF